MPETDLNLIHFMDADIDRWVEEVRRQMASPTSLADTSRALLAHLTEGIPLLDRDKSIIAQNAGSTAASLIASAVAAGTLAPATVDELVEVFDTVRTGVFNGTFALAGAEAVVERFESVDPSSTEVNTSAQYEGPAPSGNRPHGDVEIKFGKFRGKTIAQVHAADADYLEWLATECNNDFLKSRVREYLAA